MTSPTSTEFVYGCLQRTSTFDNRRYECRDTVTSWSTNTSTTRQTISASLLSREAGQTLFWSVRACRPYRYGNIIISGRQHICDSWPQARSVRIQAAAPSSSAPSSTATWDAIRPAFQAPSCTNCHALRNLTGTNQQQQQAVQAVINSHPTGRSVSCNGCHTDQLVRTGLPGGLLNVGWHAPPTNMDFRGRSSLQLCAMASTRPPSAPSVRDHLTRDPLILWAVAGGQQPSNGLAAGRPTSASPAFSSGVNAWISAVNAWVSAGSPCP